MKNFTRRTAAVLVVLLGVLGMGVAAAAWLATGSGSGTAKAGTAASLTVNASTGAGDLYPGTTNGDVYFTITNPNSYAVNFTDATLGAVVSSTDPACPSTDVTVDATATGLDLDAPAGTTTGQLSIADVVNMPGSDNDCQGATFSIAITLTGTQV